MSKTGKVLSAIAIVILLLVGCTFLLPRHVKVERSLAIDAPAEVVFSQVNGLRNWENWSPWKEKDPNMELTYGTPSAGAGAEYSWSSDHNEVGKGSLTIEASEAPRMIKTKLQFEGMNPGYGGWNFEPKGNQTVVTWYMDSDMGNDPLGRVFGAFMDDLVGPDFEKGLANIKRISERTAKASEG
ncbi:MAG: SRPBCC family protein [Bacteroidota bacterium]